MVPLIPVRYIFTALAFIGFVFNYTLRVGRLNFHRLDSFPDQHEPGDHFDGQSDSAQHQPGKTRSPGKCQKCKATPLIHPQSPCQDGPFVWDSVVTGDVVGMFFAGYMVFQV